MLSRYIFTIGLSDKTSVDYTRIKLGAEIVFLIKIGEKQITY
jgi:hypothetical protein